MHKFAREGGPKLLFLMLGHSLRKGVPFAYGMSRTFSVSSKRGPWMFLKVANFEFVRPLATLTLSRKVGIDRECHAGAEKCREGSNGHVHEEVHLLGQTHDVTLFMAGPIIRVRP